MGKNLNEGKFQKKVQRKFKMMKLSERLFWGNYKSLEDEDGV